MPSLITAVSLNLGSLCDWSTFSLELNCMYSQTPNFSLFSHNTQCLILFSKKKSLWAFQFSPSLEHLVAQKNYKWIFVILKISRLCQVTNCKERNDRVDWKWWKHKVPWFLTLCTPKWLHCSYKEQKASS